MLCGVCQEAPVVATDQWFSSSAAAFRALGGRTGVAELAHYSAQFHEWGRGRPLVLVPGLAGGVDLLGPLARELSRNFHVISYQLRGENDCFVLRRRFRLPDLVQDLREFVASRGLERPIICGVSFGGVLALEYAARFPHAVDAVAVQGVGVRYERGLLQRIASLVLTGYPLPPNSPFVNQFFNLLFGARQNRSVFEFVTRQCWETDQSVMAHRLHLVERCDLGPRLGRISTRTCVLAGERDLLVSPASLADLAAGLKNGVAELLPQCGHLAFVTNPGLVARRWREFILSAV
jgi:pimeloyl-ACP methyl ester carboxylesterase